MKILFISSNKNLLDKGHKDREMISTMSKVAEAVHVIVFTLKSEGFEMEKLDDHTWIYPTNSSSPFFYGFDAFGIIHSQVYWQWKLRVDLVISDDPFLSGWIGSFIARWYKRRWIVNVYKDYWRSPGLQNATRRRFSLLSVKYLIKHAESICLFSNDAQKLFNVRSGDEAQNKVFSFATLINVQMIRNGEINADIHARYPEYKFIILVASPLEPNKKVELALDTLQLLRETKYPLAGLVIVGRGSLKHSLEVRVQEMGLAEWVSFEEGDEYLDSYFKTANVFLNFSSLEDADERYVFVRAAAAGCAIISTDSELVRDIIHDQENGFLITEDTAASFMGHILKLNETIGLREQFKINSDQYIQDKFAKSPEDIADKFKEIWLRGDKGEIILSEKDEKMLLEAKKAADIVGKVADDNIYFWGSVWRKTKVLFDKFMKM